jgi:hypothetical protein
VTLPASIGGAAGGHLGAGVALIASGVAVGLFAGLVLKRRLPGAAVIALLAACSAVVGAGAVLIQQGARVAEVVLTMGVLALLAPLNWRLLRGSSGRNTP